MLGPCAEMPVAQTVDKVQCPIPGDWNAPESSRHFLFYGECHHRVAARVEPGKEGGRTGEAHSITSACVMAV